MRPSAARRLGTAPAPERLPAAEPKAVPPNPGPPTPPNPDVDPFGPFPAPAQPADCRQATRLSATSEPSHFHAPATMPVGTISSSFDTVGVSVVNYQARMSLSWREGRRGRERERCCGAAWKLPGCRGDHGQPSCEAGTGKKERARPSPGCPSHPHALPGAHLRVAR